MHQQTRRTESDDRPKLYGKRVHGAAGGRSRDRQGPWFGHFPPAPSAEPRRNNCQRLPKRITLAAKPASDHRLGTADADRRFGPRDQERTRKAARAENTRGAEARVTALSRPADLRRTGRSSAVRAGDRRRGWRAVRHQHPVNTEIIKSMTIRPSHEPPAAAEPPSPGVRPRRVARSPRTASHKASRRAPPCGQPACAGQSQRRHGWGELPCMLR